MTRLQMPTAVMTLAVAVGCGGGAAGKQTTSSAAAEDVHAYDPCAGGDAALGAVSCDGWPSWPQINVETFQSEGHQSAWVDVHVDPAFVDAYRAGVGPMPVGMRIVKAAHADAGGAPGEVTGLTVMAKMEAGYDADNGDWYYGVYDPTGTVAKKQGKLDMCIGCHGQWAEHDYLGGVPGLWGE